MRRILASLAPFAALGLLASSGHGQTINWGDALGTTLTQSDGSPLDNTFTIELGYFDNMFVPVLDPNDPGQNLELWASNWRVFDRADFNPSLSYFAGSATLNADGTSSSPDADPPGFVFPAGGQAYLWVFNTKNPSYPGAEWALVTNDSSDGDPTDNWVFPGPANDPPTDDTPLAGPRDTPEDWRLAFDLRTTEVPEPSAFVLLLFAALGGLRRRRP